MKARVKATGEIIDIAYTYKTVGTNPISKCETLKGKRYNEDDLDFNIEDDNTPDYWEKLRHQAAINIYCAYVENNGCEWSLDQAIKEATALVNKLKGE